MKIAIFSDTFYPELGGIMDSIVALAKELGRQGDSVNFYVPRYSRKNYLLAHRPQEEPDLGPNVHVIRLPSIPYPTPTNQGRITLFSPFLLHEIKKWNPDIIHTQLFYGAGLMALRTAAHLKKPIIGTNHMAIAEFGRYVPFGLESLSGLIVKYTVWYYNKCDFVTAPSQSVFDEMEKLGFNKPHAVISNPIELENFYPVASEEQRNKLKTHFGLTGPVLTYAGRLASEKGVDVLIRAMVIIKKSFPDAQLALAGHGVQQKELEKLAQSLGLEGNVKFLGLLEHPELGDLCRATDIFTIASTSETQGMSMMQAMATKLPVIGVRARALPEYLNRNNGFIVEPGDSQALAEKAILLLNNTQLRFEMGQNGFEFVQSFSPEKIALAWKKFYQDTIDRYNNK